ncbi:MAG: filamentous hemagglutinin N-terminal domain-containing protein, partial [Syntrophobacteraceae bacterium]
MKRRSFHLLMARLYVQEKQTMLKRLLTVVLCFWIAFPQATSMAASPQIPGLTGGIKLQTIAPNTLPVVKNIGQGIAGLEVDSSNNKLTIRQNEPKAIIDWERFDIGESAWTHFDQKKNKDWVALNRIWDRNPSQILGKLTADGKIYLVNQNGIMFGPKSQVNVHSLTASTLNIKDEDFLNNVRKFKAEDYLDGDPEWKGNGSVSNQGSIKTDSLGSVFLLGEKVENSGLISTPVGQVGLAAGSEVEIYADSEANRSALWVSVKKDPGEAVNHETGKIIADTGLVGMYGRTVTQNGLAKAATAIKKRGSIELNASETISTGSSSRTISPVSSSLEKAHESFSFQGGNISLQGLNTDPTNPSYSPSVKRIEHRGLIKAPSGYVTLYADERVYLETGSTIDVKGNWVGKSPNDLLVEAQLNSVNLRDYFFQKNGVLQGYTISVNPLYGSSIGDISGYLVSQDKTAQERATTGGTVNITSVKGDTIFKKGATIDISGGGIRWEAGEVATTKLMAGNKIYDISSAPSWLVYDRVLDKQTVVHKKYGIVDTYYGLFFGGTAVFDTVQAHVEGHDAGLVAINSRHLLLAGNIDASVTKGIFQTRDSELLNEFGDQKTRGLKEPKGGSLLLGNRPAGGLAELEDFGLDAVRIASSAPGAQEYGPDTNPYIDNQIRESVISTQLLNESGFNSVEVYANTTFTVESGARINLSPGSSFSAAARRFEQYGQIIIPSGTIDLKVRDNLTSLENISQNVNERYVPLQTRLFLGDRSRISASGQIIDNSQATLDARGTFLYGKTTGGSISLEDGTAAGDGVIMTRGAMIDVNGGFEVSRDGSVTGGDAGTLSVRGPSVFLEGSLQGLSLVGSEGGKITLHARDLSVSPVAPSLPDSFKAGDPLPDDLAGRLVLAHDRLDQTGFTQIELKGENGVSIEEGTVFSPSYMKLALPSFSGSGANGPDNYRETGNASTPYRSFGQLAVIAPELAGTTSIKLTAGDPLFGNLPNDSAPVTVAANTEIRVAPGGTCALEGGSIFFNGLIDAPAGKIELAASRYNIEIGAGAKLLACGYNKPDSDPAVENAPAGFTPMSGGQIALRAQSGSILSKPGFVMDVSGASAVTEYVRGIDGLPVPLTVAGQPGSLSISYAGDLELEGTLLAHSAMPSLKGGSLSLFNTDFDKGLEVSGSMVSRYIKAGFDDLTFGSWKAISFSGSPSLSVPRVLTLDTPEIKSSEDQYVRLSAPWIRLTNSFWPFTPGASDNEARIDIRAGTLDVEGSVAFSGFGKVNLLASDDLRLADRKYDRGQGYTPHWKGLLETSGDLTLRADRIYPTTLSDFTIRSQSKITILPGDAGVKPPVYSAGGKLTLEAADIEHRGALYAPMGSLSLVVPEETGRVYLGKGSILGTKGETAVNLGWIEDYFWVVEDKATLQTVKFTGLPESSIDIKGSEVIMSKGSRIDASGGGSVFAYQFLPGIDGSTDPLEGKSVILPNSGVSLPGDAVYLSGTNGIKEGVYSLLPARFAFYPGAMVVSDLGTPLAIGGTGLSKEGYVFTSGYGTVVGTDIRPSMCTAFSIRPASEVLKEGYFTQMKM